MEALMPARNPKLTNPPAITLDPKELGMMRGAMNLRKTTLLQLLSQWYMLNGVTVTEIAIHLQHDQKSRFHVWIDEPDFDVIHPNHPIATQHSYVRLIALAYYHAGWRDGTITLCLKGKEGTLGTFQYKEECRLSLATVEAS